MATFTWVTGSQSLAGAVGAQILPAITLTTPPGAIVKRFQLRMCRHFSVQSGNGINQVGPGSWSHGVEVGRFGHPPKSAFSSIRAIPGEMTALYDPATFERIYGQFTQAGDVEIGFNLGCSYGKHTDPFGPTFIYTGEIDGFGAPAPPPNGEIDYTFAVLYELL